MASKNEKQKKFYAFLRKYAKSRRIFTPEDVAKATGWTGTTPQTNLRKQVKDYTEGSRGRYTVKPEFLDLSVDEFLSLVSQKEPALPQYARASYDYVVTYEFLLPLTREDKLRRALDALFYRDTLETRCRLVDLKTLQRHIPRKKGERKTQYTRRVCDEVARMFGGYSISHVGGRFRIPGLLTQMESIGQRYIIDETTAVVRFIVPCECSRKEHLGEFDASYAIQVDLTVLQEEMAKIRSLFFLFFVESIVHKVLEEDEIWLLETAGDRNRLFKWEKT